MLARGRGAACRLDDEDRRHARRAGTARRAARAQQAAGPAGVPPPPLPALHALSVRRAVAPRIAISPRGDHAGRVLRVADGDDGGDGNGLRQAALLCGITGHAVARQRQRAHRLPVAFSLEHGPRSHGGPVRPLARPLDGSDRLRAVPGARGVRARGRRAGDPLSLGPRRPRGPQRGAPHVCRKDRAAGASDLALHDSGGCGRPDRRLAFDRTASPSTAHRIAGGKVDGVRQVIAAALGQWALTTAYR